MEKCKNGSPQGFQHIRSSELSASKLLSCQSLSAVSLCAFFISCLLVLISVLSVNTHPPWLLIRDYFVCLHVRYSCRSGVCRSDVSTSCHPHLWFYALLCFCPPLFHTCSCMEHTSSFYLCVLPSSFSRILFPSFHLLSCCHPLIFSRLACLHPVLPSFDSSLFSHFHHPSSPSSHISTSDEQRGGDCSASLCSHFMVWLKNWDRKESEAEGRESRRTSGECKNGESWSKEKQKGDEKGNQLETDRVQRACLFTIVCEHDGEINHALQTL